MQIKPAHNQKMQRLTFSLQAALSDLKTFIVALYMSLEKIADAAILVLFSIIVTAIAGVQVPS
jgi:hypothetical protein